MMDRSLMNPDSDACSSPASLVPPADEEPVVSNLLLALGASPAPREFMSLTDNEHNHAVTVWWLRFSQGGPSSPNPSSSSLTPSLGLLSDHHHHPAEEEEAVSRPLRVLVVEDNISSSKFLCKLLQKLGCQTVAAYTGPQAVQLVSQELESLRDDDPTKPPFDIIFCDRDMDKGDYDGFEAARRIREMPSCQDIPIIATTGSERPPCISCYGLDMFLAKPFTRASINFVVQSVRLGNRRDSLSSADGLEQFAQR